MAYPTRVLFLNTRDAIGADVAVHQQLIRFLDRTRTEPSLISNSKAMDASQMQDFCASVPDLKARFTNLGLPSDQMAALGRSAKLSSIASLGMSLVGVASEIKRKKIQVIHATDRPRDAFFATLLGKITGTASVVHMHSNCGDHLSKQTLYGLRNATGVFAISEFIRQELIREGVSSDRTHLLYNASDPVRFEPALSAAKKQDIRSQLGFAPEDYVIGTVARLIPWKGQRELIQAVASLITHNSNLKVLIVGTGPDLDELQCFAAGQGIADRVIFAGWHDDVAPLLAAMDVFALPSYEEPFGLAITEAMAMELPVIACNSGGVPEIITHGVDGWLVEPRSAQGITTAISAFAADTSFSRKIGSAARQTVIDRFSPKAQADLASSLYARLATRGQS